MSLLEGKLGEKINCLLDESNNQFDLGKYELSIQTLIKAWNELPNKKYDYSESYLIVWGILDIAIKINDFNTMKKWVEKIFLADPER